ncbi:MAG: outer membrane lipid asymmetry maintenance protein MlaD [Deltaproteobacteria bacterium]|nr:outer membrane lipid asymmetry maintenance protein MlaD [Deltaproteobacteria bacterium]
MSQTRTEIAVGIFVLAGAACLVYLSLAMGGLGGFNLQQYKLYATFQTVQGLKVGAPVELAGVQVGRVNRIDLDEDFWAKVELTLDKSIQLDEDVICSLKTKGILGEKYIRLEPGGADEIIPPGGRIRETVPGVDVEDLISKFIHGQL